MLLILGLSAMIKPIEFKRETRLIESYVSYCNYYFYDNLIKKIPL